MVFTGSPFTLFPADQDPYTISGSRSPYIAPSNTNYRDITTSQRPQNRNNWTFQKFLPVLALNMWQETYLTDYGLDKATYIDNFWKVINWDLVHQRLFKNESLQSQV